MNNLALREMFDRLRHHPAPEARLVTDARLLLNILLPQTQAHVRLDSLPAINTEQHFTRRCSEDGHLYSERLRVQWPARSEGRIRIEHAVAAATLKEEGNRPHYMLDTLITGRLEDGKAYLRSTLLDPLTGKAVVQPTTPSQLEQLFRICVDAAQDVKAPHEAFPVNADPQAAAIVMQMQTALFKARADKAPFSLYPRKTGPN